MRINPKAPDVRKMRLSTSLSQTDFWKPLGVSQSGGSRYELEPKRIPLCIQLLLTIAYGEERDGRAVVNNLRGVWTAD
ncbi:MAG: hypothetical protein LBG61_00360 [Burkholderiales bacterium]|nr:hypothetical protein [Burkholderiales bacterium]